MEINERVNAQSIDQLPDFTTSFLPYDAVELKVGDVVYADPPYANTEAPYCKDFDHERFWNWVRCQARLGVKVFVSEYNAPEDFVEIFRCEKDRAAGGGKSKKFGKAIEKIFIHRRFA